MAALFIIFIFRIPFKLIKLAYYFILENDKGLKRGLKSLYNKKYEKIKNNKIEILNKEIYLNGGKLKTFVGKLWGGKMVSEEQLYICCKALQSEFEKFSTRENTFPKQTLNIISAVGAEKNIIFGAHWGNIENDKTIHGTSKLPNKLLPTQFADRAMKSLTLPEAPNPATIISTEIKKVIIDKTREKEIPKLELDQIKYNHPTYFDSPEHFNYIWEKEEKIKEIIEIHLGLKEYDSTFIEEIRMGVYDDAIINANDDDFKQEICEIFDDRNN